MDVSKGDGFDVLCPFLGRTDGPCSFVSTGAAVTPFPRHEAHLEQSSQTFHDHSHTQSSLHERPHSRYAYVAMLANPSRKSKARTYLLDFLVAAASIRKTGSTHEIVALVYGAIEDSDVALLESEGIKVHMLRTDDLQICTI
jgi:hypothetical protein